MRGLIDRPHNRRRQEEEMIFGRSEDYWSISLHLLQDTNNETDHPTHCLVVSPGSWLRELINKQNREQNCDLSVFFW